MSGKFEKSSKMAIKIGGGGFLELVFGYYLEIYFPEVTELYFTFYHNVGFIFYYFNSAFEIVFGGMAKIVYCINA